jgi:hypothetical protein
MITAAHVGIGIKGVEGQQAARSSLRFFLTNRRLRDRRVQNFEEAAVLLRARVLQEKRDPNQIQLLQKRGARAAAVLVRGVQQLLWAVAVRDEHLPAVQRFLRVGAHHRILALRCRDQQRCPHQERPQLLQSGPQKP